jgi:trehalose 2-sulfotransferase
MPRLTEADVACVVPIEQTCVQPHPLVIFSHNEEVLMPIHQSYLVCATPRSGSTLFCEALSATAIAGYPKEYFEALKETGLPRQPQQYFSTLADSASTEYHEILDLLGNPPLDQDTAVLKQWSGRAYANYLREVLEQGTTPSGVFGTKMMWGYFADFVSLARQIPTYQGMDVCDLVASIFPNVRYIWVTRQNKEGQAISLWKAIQTQHWRKDSGPLATNGSSARKKELVFHFGAISHLEQQILANEAAWQHYFKAAGIQPLVIVYEDLIRDYEVTLQKALHYLAIPLPKDLVFARPRMEQQSDTHSQEWVQRYRQLKQQAGETTPGNTASLKK